MDYNMYNNKPLVKPELNSADSCSSSSHSSRDQQPQQPNFPEWINEFNKECVKICGTRCSEKLDEIMEAYIQEIKKELILCDSSPNRASLIANRMSKTMMFFYLYYSDIKEFFVISQWSEHISQLLLFYCRLELKAAHRVHRGKDSDSLVCLRITNALWIYLNNNFESMIHVVLQLPQIGRRHKDILDPIFRKLLLNKKQKPLAEMEYIRNLLAFKLWKRLYGKEDKKAISQLALTELRPPRSFVANYKKYKFLPACPTNIDIHAQFVTGLIDLDSAIKEYLEVFHKNKRTDYHPTEKKSFISEFCSSFEGLDNTSDDLSDSYMLDKIKNENDIEEIEDDDCIIIDDSSTPPPIVQRIIPPNPTEVIDLTADEPEPQINLTETDDVVPLWCQELIKQSEELKITPPLSPVVEKPVEMTEEPKMEIITPRKEVIISTSDIVTPVKEVIKEVERKEMRTPIKDVVSPKREIITPRTEITLPKSPTPSPPAPSPSLSPSPPPPPPPPPPPLPPIEEPKETRIAEEDNSVGLREITSTSHPVEDIAQDVADSSVFTPTESFPEQSNKEIYSENFEHVDSTSNINEEEDCEVDVETPTIKTFVVERTVEDGVVCSEVISEITPESERVEEDISEQTVSAVSNIEFEQFASQNVTNGIIISHVSGKSDNIVETSRLVSDSDELIDGILDEDSAIIDPGLDNNNTEAQLLLDKESDGSINSHTEIDDFTSPAIEPMSGKDFANYLAGINSELYEEFNKNPEPVNGDLQLQLSKKRKIEDHSVVRTYTKRAPKFDTVLETPEPVIPESEPEPEPESPKERRVPINGEKVVLFANVWESFYTGTLNLTQKESKLFMPNVMMKKENPRYWIPDYEKYTSAQTDDVLDPLKNPPTYDYLHGFAVNSSAKKILERQDYLKPKRGEENPRARVIRRPTAAGFADPAAKDPKLPDVIMQTKKRGPRKQATTEVVKKRKVGRRKSTRPPAESSPLPPVEQIPEITPWRFSVPYIA